MFKIDWPCAIGGLALGYIAKSKVESAKTQFKGIYTGAISTLKESFADCEKPQATKQPQAPQGKTGKNNGNGN